jgi:peptide/nickel transport system permease protein
MSASRTDTVAQNATLAPAPGTASTERPGQPARVHATGSREWRRFRRNARAMAGGVAILLLVLVGLLAPVLAPYNPDTARVEQRLASPQPAHLMGTDQLGRDILSRALYASRVSLSIAVVAMIVSSVVGVAVGLAAGYYGGWVDAVLMRITDFVLALPIFFLLLAVLALFGSSVPLLTLVLGLTAWPGAARVVRGEVLSLMGRDFMLAARAAGAGDLRLMARHLAPNVVAVVVVSATLRIAFAILAEAGLSFLGIGVQPPTASWGNMVAGGRQVLDVAPWVSLFPGLFVFFAVASFNLFGDGIRDAFDPNMRT